METAATDRQARREELRARLHATAEAEAQRIGRSIKCGSPPGYYEGFKHADDPDGCKNDGSSCLCECHD